MAERVYLHVGTPKSGTTYLQTIIWHNQAALLQAGILLPGRRMWDHNQAATYVRSAKPGPRSSAVWARLVKQVNDHPGVAVLSNEWLSLADAHQSMAATAAFGEAEVHVVLTARDLVGLAPAAWQETLKLGNAMPLADFIDSLDVPQPRWQWGALDPAVVAETWSSSLPPERVHIVTAPVRRMSPNELWDRFALTVGIPQGSCDLGVASANESIGVESARLLELLGPRLRDAIDTDNAVWTEQYRWLRRYLSHGLLVPRGGSKIGLPEDTFDRLRKRSLESASAIAQAGYDIVGSIDDLNAVQPDPTAVLPEDVTDRQLFELASELVVDLLRELRTTSNDLRPVPDGL